MYLAIIIHSLIKVFEAINRNKRNIYFIQNLSKFPTLDYLDFQLFKI